MTNRVNEYFMLPASDSLTDHFENDIGLKGKYLEIFNDLRENLCDTKTHAENVGLPIKQYNEMSAIVCQKCLWELWKLAERGYKAEDKMN